jgi:hypothetical protein
MPPARIFEIAVMATLLKPFHVRKRSSTLDGFYHDGNALALNALVGGG